MFGVEKQFRVTAVSCESVRQRGVQHFPALSIRETRGVQESVTGRIVVRSRLGRAEERQMWDVWFVYLSQYASAMMMRMQVEGFCHILQSATDEILNTAA